jgi:hypothetical protein
MVTALNLYGTNAASSTLSTAGLLVNATGASGNGQSTTKCGTSTGYSEIYALGTTSAWAAAGSLASVVPSGNGWLFDVTTLEQQQMAAGTYTPKHRAKISVGTATVDMYERIYKLANDLTTYTLIGDCSLTGQSFTTTIANYNFGGNSLSAMSFGLGDKLYRHVVYDITANSSGSSAATIAFTNANSATQGRASNAELDTPGYRSSVTVNMQITNVGLNLLRDGKSGANNPKITYFALGTGSSTPGASNTALDTEVFRKAVTTFTNGSTGEILIALYLSPTDAVGINIAEVGLFGGSAASLTPGTGVLYARGLYSHPSKANTESIQFTLDDLLHL